MIKFFVTCGLLVASTASLITSLLAQEMYSSIISAVICGLIIAYILKPVRV